MKLITLKQAAALANVSYPTIRYWVRTGRLAKHPYPLSYKSQQLYKRDNGVRYFLVSEEEVRRCSTVADSQTVRKKLPDKNLITPLQAASAMYRSKRWTTELINRTGVTKYRYGKGQEYFIDQEEFRRALIADKRTHLAAYLQKF